jgi:DNA-binding LacI/PurR family transcriptional regulator
MSILGKQIDKAASVPAHVQVRDRLLDLIQNGDLVPGQKLPPEPDIATMLGVSRMTANKSILALVADGYLVREKGRGTFVSQRLAPGLTRCAVAIREDPSGALEDYYFGALYWGVHSTLAAQGVGVEVVRLNSGLGDSPTKDTGLIAINPSEESLDELLAYARGGAPVVILGASWSDYGLSTVDSDNLLGAALAVNHLADLGHRRILFLGACPQDSNTVDRVRGFQTAMKARLLPVGEESLLVVDEALGFDAAIEEDLFRRIAQPDGPTAVFAAGSRLAMQLLAGAQKRGLSVPQDLSIVGYDDPDFLSLAYPPITTVRQPLSDMAAAACAVLLGRLETRDPRPAKRLLDPELIVRGTASAPQDPSSHLSEEL